MLQNLLTEQRNPASADIDALPTESILRVINDLDHDVAPAVRAVIPQISRAVEAAVKAIENGGRLFYIGAGTSGRLGVLDASECPPTFNVSPVLVQGIIAGGESALTRSSEGSEDQLESGARDLLDRGFGPNDIVVGLAASGRTPYVIGAVRKAREIGAVTVGVSCTPDSLLSGEVDIAIEPLPGPEAITGSTRMRAGTATKMVLNMLSTAVMIRLGHVYGNLMVNVQPTNEKLVDRAVRIVSAAASLDYGEAARFLESSGRNVKTAIVMARLGLSRDAAREKLAAAGGRIAAALGQASTPGQ